jgi:hypothetical protein
MKINIKKEQDKMKKNMRKIGDRSGIGFADDDDKDDQDKGKKKGFGGAGGGKARDKVAS